MGRRFFEELKAGVKQWLANCKERRQAKSDARLDIEAREKVQVMEYNSVLYVSVNGIPLFNIDDFKVSVSEAVARGRMMYKDWQEEKQWENGTMHGFTHC